MSGQSQLPGNGLTASNSEGDATWSTAGLVGGWTTSGNNVYETNGGNVGIGTTFLTTSRMSVTKGHLGLSTCKSFTDLGINGAAAIGSSYAGVNTAPTNGL